MRLVAAAITGVIMVAALSVCHAQVREETTGVASRELAHGSDVVEVPGMVYIPAGEFISGTTEEEKQELSRKYSVDVSWFQGEPPQERERTEVFYIDRYEVTNAQFKEYMDATRRRTRPAIWFNDWPEGFGNLPVCGVNYDMAAGYARWAGKRLPTPLEWEKAARGTDGRRYPWGDEWAPDACDHADAGAIPRFPKPVGYFPKDKSPYGIYGCAGGAAEWAASGLSWTGGTSPNLSWSMGGSFIFTEPYNFRCATRAFTQMRNNRLAFQGFRCALDEDKAAEWVTEHPDPVLAQPGSRPVVIKARPATGSDEPIRLTSEGKGAFVSITVPAMGDARFAFQVPEVIFSSRGAVFIGHKMRGDGWEVSPDGMSAQLRHSQPGKVGIIGILKAGGDYVDYELTVTNNGEQPLGGVLASSCLATGGEPLFRDPEQRRTVIITEKGWTPVSNVNRGDGLRNLYRKYRVAGTEYDKAHPKLGQYEATTKAQSDLLAITSIDNQWVIAVAAQEGSVLMSNAEYSCLHSEPHFGTIEPGKSIKRRGRLYFMRGSIEGLAKRAAEDGFGSAQ